jgi:hypothetical protein
MLLHRGAIWWSFATTNMLGVDPDPIYTCFILCCVNATQAQCGVWHAVDVIFSFLFGNPRHLATVDEVLVRHGPIAAQ